LFWANALVCFQLSTERKDGPGLLAFSVLLALSLMVLSLMVLSPLMLSLLALSLLSLLAFDCMFGVMNEKQYAFHSFNFFFNNNHHCRSQ
jgi:hypothetical protein